jgi:cytochrome P450
MKQQLQFTKNLFVPMINERRKAEAANDPGYVRPDDFLQWTMDGAEDEHDRNPEMLAHHMLLLMSLAIVHTSTMAMCHMLYDLIHHSEYLGPLRDEITQTLPDGWENATKTSFDAQRRMDSFMRESQRFGPPGECELYSVLRQSISIVEVLLMLTCNSVVPPHREGTPHIIRWTHHPRGNTHMFPFWSNKQGSIHNRESRAL